MFGPYAGTSSTAQSTKGNDYSDYLSNPNLLCPAAVGGNSLNGNTMIGKANTMHDLTATQGVPAMAAADFYQNNRGASAVSAFTSAGNGDATGWVAGDKYLFVNKSGTPLTSYTAGTAYAMNVNDIVNGGQSSSTNVYASNWETKGYKKYTGNALQRLHRRPRLLGQDVLHLAARPQPGLHGRRHMRRWRRSRPSGAKSASGTGTGTNDWRQNFFYNSTGSRAAAHQQHHSCSRTAPATTATTASATTTRPATT